MISLILASFLSVLINYLVVINKFARAVFFLISPELILRTIRVYITQVSFVISPLGNIEGNIGRLFKAYKCTGDKAIEAGRNVTNHLKSEAVEVASSFLDTVHAISYSLKEYVIAPIESVHEFLGGSNEFSLSLFNFDAIQNELTVNISLMHNFTSVLNQTIFEDFKSELRNDFGWTVDVFLYCRLGLGFMFCLNILFLILKKINLVWYFRKGESLPKENFSNFLWVLNPFVMQGLLLVILAVVDFLVHYLYDLQKEQLEERPMEFGTGFWANVVLNEGGHIARVIANLMQATLDRFTKYKISRNLASCYETPLNSPAYFSYLCSLVVCYIGYNSYKVDELCKQMQDELIDIAHAVWGPLLFRKLVLICSFKMKAKTNGTKKIGIHLIN